MLKEIVGKKKQKQKNLGTQNKEVCLEGGTACDVLGQNHSLHSTDKEKWQSSSYCRI